MNKTTASLALAHDNVTLSLYVEWADWLSQTRICSQVSCWEVGGSMKCVRPPTGPMTLSSHYITQYKGVRWRLQDKHMWLHNQMNLLWLIEGTCSLWHSLGTSKHTYTHVLHSISTPTCTLKGIGSKGMYYRPGIIGQLILHFKKCRMSIHSCCENFTKIKGKHQFCYTHLIQSASTSIVNFQVH